VSAVKEDIGEKNEKREERREKREKRRMLININYGLTIC
jgi:hypothetical protein